MSMLPCIIYTGGAAMKATNGTTHQNMVARLKNFRVGESTPCSNDLFLAQNKLPL